MFTENEISSVGIKMLRCVLPGRVCLTNRSPLSILLLQIYYKFIPTLYQITSDMVFLFTIILGVQHLEDLDILTDVHLIVVFVFP